jgi:hypothetical protein
MLFCRCLQSCTSSGRESGPDFLLVLRTERHAKIARKYSQVPISVLVSIFDFRVYLEQQVLCTHLAPNSTPKNSLVENFFRKLRVLLRPNTVVSIDIDEAYDKRKLGVFELLRITSHAQWTANFIFVRLHVAQHN